MTFTHFFVQYLQLVQKYICSTKTIQRKLDSVKLTPKTTFLSVANVLTDTTYFGRKFGVMVFKDSITGDILIKQYVKKETNLLYLKGIEEIAKRGIKIQSIICDGRKGLFQLFPDIPVQMCNFHQVAIVRRYLTKNPNFKPAKCCGRLHCCLKIQIKKALKDCYSFGLKNGKTF